MGLPRARILTRRHQQPSNWRALVDGCARTALAALQEHANIATGVLRVLAHQIKVACDPRLPPNVSPICAMSRLSLTNYAMRPVVLFTSTHGKSEPGGKRHLEYTGEESRVAAVVCVSARFTLVQRGSVQCRSVCPQW